MIRKYDTDFDTDDPVAVELECIRMGGRWKGEVTKKEKGLGIVGHHKAFQKLILPDKQWHRWNELTLPYLADPYYRLVGLAGKGSSGKTHEAACVAATIWCARPNETTILVSSTDSRSLRMRIFGEIVKVWDAARRVSDAIPGRLIASQMAIISEGEDESSEDFRNAIVGVPCMIGGSFVGLGKYVGIKNKYIILIADEASLMSDSYGKGVTSLEQNPGFRCWPLANPKDRFDAFGKLVEPADSEGGWSITEDIKKTTVWKTRKDRGVCINLVGTDSPNHDEPKNRFAAWMPSVEDVDASLAYYGKDSAMALMFVLGIFPKDAQSRRVLTRQMVSKFSAQEDVIWEMGPSFKVVGLDAAYGAVGGDRTPLIELHVGKCHDGKQRVAIANGPVLIPVKASLPELPEDQIATYVMKYCQEREIPAANVFFDSTGRGSLVSSFGRLWSTAVNGIEFGGVASNRPVSSKPVGPNIQQVAKTCREHYVDFVSELWFLAQVLVEGDQVRQLPTDVMDEGIARAWDFQSSIGRVKIYVESKPDMKLRFGRSPDLFDCFVCGLEGARRLGLAVGGSPKRMVDLEDLMKDFQEQRTKEIRARELTY